MTHVKEEKTNTIFVQIASYRDHQLIPTIEDMFSNAKYPENLVVGICWQHSLEDSWDNLSKYNNSDQFKIIDVDYNDSQGVCWARNKVQSLYNGEKYTLQLDSHHRFAKNWDETLINMLTDLQSKGYAKPLITAYIPSFDPDNDPVSRINTPWKMNFDRFIPEGAIFFLPASFDSWDNKNEPLPSRFYSAHFAFTVGEFCYEVPHDPNYYFHGEEISIAVRAFTHGYDLFHPHKVVCWHEYTRKGRTKQWDDDKSWVEKNNRSHNRNKKLFEMDGQTKDIDFEKYDFGTVRTPQEYEIYSGISFKHRAIQKRVLDHKSPPDPDNKNISYSEFESTLLKIFKHCIDIGYDKVPENDYDFWCVVFKDINDNDIYRQDADINEIHRMKNDPDNYCKIWREFQTDIKPSKWIVWPHSKSKGWCEQITGHLI